jgi:hypothetical protein
VLNGGNPTAGIDPDEVAPFDGGVGYPVGTLPDVHWKGSVYDFSRNRSPDGALESKGPAFGGALNGYLFVVEYSAGDDVLALPIPPDGGPIDPRRVPPGGLGLSDPIDIAEDVNTGNLYVAQLVQGGADGGAIILLRPDGEPRMEGRMKRAWTLAWWWWPSGSRRAAAALAGGTGVTVGTTTRPTAGPTVAAPERRATGRR